jgi:hypothetical protein
MKLKILLTLPAFYCVSLVADVSLDVEMGDFFSADGTDAPIGTYAILVSDTGSDGFLGSYTSAADADFSIFSGTSLTSGSILSGTGNDEIIGVFQMADLGTGGSSFFSFLTGIDISGSSSLSSGQNLAVYWFPTITNTSITGSVNEYGFYRSDSVDTASGSDIAFVMPTDGAYIFAEFPDAASFTAVAVPEPSTYAALLGALALGFVAYRRRRF